MSPGGEQPRLRSATRADAPPRAAQMKALIKRNPLSSAPFCRATLVARHGGRLAAARRPACGLD